MQNSNKMDVHEHDLNCCGERIGSTINKCYWCDHYRDISDCDECECHYLKCSVTGRLCYRNYKNIPPVEVNECTCYGVDWVDDKNKVCNQHFIEPVTEPLRQGGIASNPNKGRGIITVNVKDSKTGEPILNWSGVCDLPVDSSELEELGYRKKTFSEKCRQFAANIFKPRTFKVV